MRRITGQNALVVLFTLATVVAGYAQDSYLRLQRDGGRPSSLQTAITRLEEPGGAYVDLVGVIHVADEDYYKRLNKHFKGYDSVLFEMVLDVPRSVQHQNNLRTMFGYEKRRPVIDTSRGGRDPVSNFQRYLAKLLGLSFQLSHIDYKAANFHHADLTLEEFEEAMASRGETPTTLFKKLTENVADDDPPEYKAIADLPLLKIAAMGPSEAERKVLKIGMAANFASLDASIADIQGSALINDRNNRALEILRQRVKIGEKKLAVFYGAAHMPDMVKQLKAKGWKRQSKSWLTAWKL